VATLGSVLGQRAAEIAAHFEDLHGSLDRLWFATVLSYPTELDSADVLSAMRAAYTRCEESFSPRARTKVHAPTVVASKHIREALAAASSAKEYGL